MSREAIAAALARVDLSCGERLVAFSLASFADRENRARPGTPAAAGRAGLARSRFLEARERLVDRALVAVEDAASGRGRASTVALPFAETGPWWEGEINAELFEAVLGYSPTRGPARLLLAAMAALADEHGVLESVSTEQLCAAAGVADRTYRRARTTLLASGEVILCSGSGGRGNTNCWELPNPRTHRGATQPARARRVPPAAGARPPTGTVAPPAAGDEHGIEAFPAELVPDGRGHSVGDVKGGQDRTVSVRKGPALTGDSAAKDGQDRTLLEQNRPALTGVLDVKGGQDRTVSRETPAKTPAKTPAPNARARSEPQNPRTVHPPSPPHGGSSGEQVLVEETYLTPRGRMRRHLVPVDLGAACERLRAAGKEDLAAWERVRAFLRGAVGESTFELWLERLELIAVDLEGTLIVSAPAETVGWVARRFGRILDAAAQRAGRPLQVADDVECKAAELLTSGVAAAARAAPVGVSAAALLSGPARPARRVADKPDAQSGCDLPHRPVARRDDQSADKSTYTSAYPCSYTAVYTETKEVS